jgi:hypothetical protein
MDQQFLTFMIIFVVILQLYITYGIYNLNNKKLEKFGNGCRPGQLKNFGICMNAPSY